MHEVQAFPRVVTSSMSRQTRLLRRATTLHLTGTPQCHVRTPSYRRHVSGYSSKCAPSILQRQDATTPAGPSSAMRPTQTRAITLNRDCDSHRTPGRPRWLNAADVIEDYLLKDGHIV